MQSRSFCFWQPLYICQCPPVDERIQLLPLVAYRLPHMNSCDSTKASNRQDLGKGSSRNLSSVSRRLSSTVRPNQVPGREGWRFTARAFEDKVPSTIKLEKDPRKGKHIYDAKVYTYIYVYIYIYISLLSISFTQSSPEGPQITVCT
jgi:hypothetical protein